MKKAIKYWFGPLEEDQIALIGAWSRQSPDLRAHWLSNRERWLDAFEQALQNRQEPEEFAAEIYRLFVTPEEMREPEFRELSERNRESTLQLLADLHNSRTEKQRGVERKRVAQWLERLDRLAMY